MTSQTIPCQMSLHFIWLRLNHWSWWIHFATRPSHFSLSAMAKHTLTWRDVIITLDHRTHAWHHLGQKNVTFPCKDLLANIWEEPALSSDSRPVSACCLHRENHQTCTDWNVFGGRGEEMRVIRPHLSKSNLFTRAPESQGAWASTLSIILAYGERTSTVYSDIPGFTLSGRRELTCTWKTRDARQHLTNGVWERKRGVAWGRIKAPFPLQFWKIATFTHRG